MLIATIAASANLLAALATLVLFGETLDRTSHESEESTDPLLEKPKAGLALVLGHWPFLRLMLMNFLMFGAISMFESTFALLAYMRHGLGPSEIGYVFTLLGVASVITQLAAVGPLVKRLGNRWALRLSAATYAIGLIVIGLAGNVWIMLPALMLCAASNAVFIPTSNAVASRQATPKTRGLLLGAFQASGNLGRAVPPFLSGWLFSQIGMSVPYYFGAGLVAIALIMLTLTAAKAPPPVPQPEPDGAE